MNRTIKFICLALLLSVAMACNQAVVREIAVPSTGLGSIEKEHIDEIEKIKTDQTKDQTSQNLQGVIQQTANYTVREYLAKYPEADNDDVSGFTIGPYDTLDIIVYEEKDLSRKQINVGANGFISFPLIGRIQISGMTPSEIEAVITKKLSEGEFLLNAHVSVTVREYKSKQYMVLGSVKIPGSYPLRTRKRVLDAISRAGGIDFEQGGKEGMIIRKTKTIDGKNTKIVIRIELNALLKGGDQISNLPLHDKDFLYIPKAESFHIIGEVKEPGSYPYLENEITIVGAISKAGGFTNIASRNRTRIVRMENGAEKIIEIKVDKITGSGHKGQDVIIRPGDIIIVPERFF